jgi:hypothetical protein
MMDSLSWETPTIIINRRGRSQDSSNEEKENVPPHREPMRHVSRMPNRQPLAPRNKATSRQQSRDCEQPRRMSPKPMGYRYPMRLQSQSPIARTKRLNYRSTPQWDDTPDTKRGTMRKLPNFSGKETESWQDWLMSCLL